MNVFTLLDNIDICLSNTVMDAFNMSIRSIRNLLHGGEYALDSTIIETKPNFPGCGKTKRKKEGGPPNAPPEYKNIYGFKLFILYEVKSRIVVAMKIVPANESDHKYFLPIIKQGIHNCGWNKIRLIIADRGFIDGAALWQLKHKYGIDFIIPAKKGMIVREDAISLKNNYENKTSAEWKYGKSTCRGYGIDGLRTYDEYNPPGMKNNKRTSGTPINAIVITTWRGKAVPAEDQVVLLTSLPAEKDVIAIAKGYRLRSLIENCGFRELKQATYLKCLPRRKGKTAENAAYMHIMLCVFAHTLFYAFLRYRKKEDPKQSDDNCLRKWRRQEQIEKDNKILIIAEEKYYALFDIDELLDVLGVKQKYRIRMNC